MNSALSALLAIVGGFITLAIISVVFSSKAATSSVIGSIGSAIATDITAAVNPVTGTGAATGGLGSTAANFAGPLANYFTSSIV